jgi:hypothetical protein
MPRKALMTARAALRFAQQAADERGAIQSLGDAVDCLGKWPVTGALERLLLHCARNLTVAIT